MVEPIHFTYGAVTPALAYGVSVVGCLLGLMCTARSRARQGTAGFGWLLAGAVSIGFTGIWSMHFIAMLGFTVPGTPLRYDPGPTVLSCLIAIVVVGVGLLVVTRWRLRVLSLIAGGIITGLGVVTMHYLGMHAIRLPGHIHHALPMVGLSAGIAIVAATAALWAALNVAGRVAKAGASLIMGFAVTTMHYTAMAGVSVEARTAGAEAPPAGLEAHDFLFPLIVVVGTFNCLLYLLVLLTPGEDETNHDAAAMDRLLRPQEPAAPGVMFSPAPTYNHRTGYTDSPASNPPPRTWRGR